MKNAKVYPLIVFLMAALCFVSPAVAQPLWGYHLYGTLPYNTNTHYWNKTLPQLSILCFTGITISTTCNIPSFDRYLTLFSQAHDAHVGLIPHVTFTNMRQGVAFLTSPKYWESTIRTLSEFIKQHRCTGIHFDFEYLPPTYASAYAQFLKKVRAIVTDKTISAALFPQVDFNTYHSAFHDFAYLAPYLDEIVLMCYDYHNPKTKPGPVTDINWTKKNIEYALRFFKPTQIWLGIPAYGYIWKNGVYHQVITVRSLHRYTSIASYYRHPSGNIYLEYTNGNDAFIAYVPDNETLQTLKNIALRYSLKGVALWRLGFE